MLGLTANAHSGLGTTTTTIPERFILQGNFEPPGDGKPKDTSGAGSRTMLNCPLHERPVRPLTRMQLKPATNKQPLMVEKNYHRSLDFVCGMGINLSRNVLTGQESRIQESEFSS
ncbi:MAG: hypothetical protein F6K19_34700 [Cyanothece sp. SIO1E1]|nr:hypothetical protein [Cyanothece sp. SIO1E1]